MSFLIDWTKHTINAICKRSILYHKEGGAEVRDERDADDGLEKDGRAGERARERASMVQYNRAAICTLQHYGKCSKEKEEEREGRGHYAKR